MKPAYLAVFTILSIISWSTIASAESVPAKPQGSAAQLLLQPNQRESVVENDGERFNDLEIQINQIVMGDQQDEKPIIDLSNIQLPQGIRVMESFGNYAIGTEF